MLAFLLQSAMSPNLFKEVSDERGGTSEDHTIYFDVLVWQNISQKHSLSVLDLLRSNSVILHDSESPT